MDFDSPDVEKDFPGLYASEEPGAKSKKDDVSDGEHEKTSKKELLIGRRKEKKDKKCYATLGDDEDEAAQSKSKKLKAFKFSKSKEKREKSVEKKDSGKGTLEKKKDKKSKDKKKDEKKLKTKENSEEVQELGEAQPVFGVPLNVSIERSRCHDGVDLPLVIRDCIDFLQEHLSNEHIHKSEGKPHKPQLQVLRKNYNNRESNIQDLDVNSASGLFKLYLRELPEPILTIDLLPRFEEAASLPTSTEQEKALKALIDQQLPGPNKTLLSWILLHLDAVTQNEKAHKLNAQNLAVLMSPALQMSHRLLITLLCYCSDLFPDVKLTRYDPPITSSSPNLPETKDDIAKELRKQESLLAQIHAEMHAGFVTKKREEQLWEVQRIITQLKRKLRTFEKKTDASKSVEDSLEPEPGTSIDSTLQKTKSYSDDENSSVKTLTVESNTNTGSKPSPQEQPVAEEPEDETDLANLVTTDENGFMTLPATHPDYLNLIRLQLENKELIKWKIQLQGKITAERAEVVRLKKLVAECETTPTNDLGFIEEEDAERLAGHYMKENILLQQKRGLLARDLFEEYHQLIQLEVEMELQKFTI